MKRLLLFCITLCSLAAVLGEPMRSSNSIGQDKGVWTGEGDYHLVQLPEQTQLYGPDGLLWIRQQFPDGDQHMLLTRYTDARPDLVEIYGQGKLLRRQSGSTIVYYQYADDGRLMQTTSLEDGRLIQARLYSYANTTLASILTISDSQSELRTFGRLKDSTYFAFSDAKGGQLFTTIEPGRTVGEYWIGDAKQEQVSVTTYEDGSFTIQRKGGEETLLERYNEYALLVSLETPSYIEEYSYNDERVRILQRTRTMDGRLTTNSYKDGRLVISEEEVGGRVVKSIRYNEDGSSVHTLYTDEGRYADVSYAVDGKRVLSITYY